MAALFITSLAVGAGKTTICAGLGKRFLEKGKKVGFLKLAAGTVPDGDGVFMQAVLGFEGAAEKVRVSDPTPEQAKEACSGIAAGKDVILVEAEKAEAALAQALAAKVMVVEKYGSLALDKYRDFGDSLIGVVINRVPASRVERAKGEAVAKLAETRIKLLGVLAEDRALLAPTVSEVAVALGGQVLNGDKQPAELVEGVMLGAMTLDPGPEYYRRVSHKAVIARSERADMQLAALETSTACLVLTGATPPEGVVLRKAKAKKVPVILTKEDIPGAVAKIEEVILAARSNASKLPRIEQLMRAGFDYSAVDKALGL